MYKKTKQLPFLASGPVRRAAAGIDQFLLIVQAQLPTKVRVTRRKKRSSLSYKERVAYWSRHALSHFMLQEELGEKMKMNQSREQN